MIPRSLHDLAAVVGLLVASATVHLVPGVPWPIEWAFGIPLLLVLPGYALLTALLPIPPKSRPGPGDRPGWTVRVALSLVTSVLVVAIVGTALAFRGALVLPTAVAGIGAVTLLGVIVAGLRRRSLSVDRRTLPVVDSDVVTGRRDDDLATLQTVTLLVAVLALAGTLAVVGASPPTDEAYTEVYLSSPGGADDGSSTDASTFVRGERSTVEIGLTNHRSTQTSQGVVVQLVRVGPDGAVRERERLNRFRAQLAAQENAVFEREVAPEVSGDRLQLQVLVYDGDVPSEPRPETATLSLRQWVTVADTEAV